MYVVTQGGHEAKWCKTPADVAIYLAGLFGKFSNPEWMEKIIKQVEKIKWGKALVNEDLSISVFFGGHK